MTEAEHYVSIPVSEFEELQDRIMKAEQARDEAKRQLKELQAYVHKQTEAWSKT